jgi:anaerobic magnesium-protoporphyrin IX monomethyl ester cyclase
VVPGPVATTPGDDREEVVCLVRPPVVETFRFSTGSISPPLGLAYIAAALEAAGFRVQVVDAVALAPTNHTRYHDGYLVGAGLRQIVERIPPDATLLGISVIFTHEWPAVSQLIRDIRRARPTLRVVLGGEHVTSMPEFCLATSEADWVVLGEGEETIVDLIHAIRRGDVSATAGIGYRAGDEIVLTPRRPRRRSIDDIPWPAWHLFDWKTYNQHRYVSGIDVGEVTFPVLATRGCPYQCTFCSAPNMWTTTWVPRDPVKTVDEIQHYVDAYGARNFPFQDLTAIIKRDWVIAFCQELIRRDLRISWQFPSGTRSEAVDLEVARLLRRSGMINMGYAPESGSDRTRRLIKKRVKEPQLLKSIEDSVAGGLNVNVWVVIGFPHDTPESLKENLPFVDKLAKLGVQDFGVSFYLALPGTELFDVLYQAGRIRIDGRYFSHILQGSGLLPHVSYCAALGRLRLGLWKLRLSIRFYRAKLRHAAGDGLIANLWRGIGGIFRAPHTSRLETAARNGLTSAVLTLKVLFKPRWLAPHQEAALMADWDPIYRRIRCQQDAGASPLSVEATGQPLANVNLRLEGRHSKEQRVALRRRPAAAS